MINLVISLLIGIAAFGAGASIFSWYAAILPGLLGFVVAYFLLAQRTMKQIAAISERAQKEMMAQKLDRAIETFKSGFRLEKWQFLVGSVLHANMGMLLYVKGDFEAAKRHLEKGFSRNYVAVAMLACYYFRVKDYKKMREQFELAVKHGKKEGLVWAVYAYCLFKLNERDEAMKILSRAVAANPSDEKLKTNLLALQNNKKMKMKAYTPEFYQFHVEPLPPELTGGGRRVVFQRR